MPNVRSVCIGIVCALVAFLAIAGIAGGAAYVHFHSKLKDAVYNACEMNATWAFEKRHLLRSQQVIQQAVSWALASTPSDKDKKGAALYSLGHCGASLVPACRGTGAEELVHGSDIQWMPSKVGYGCFVNKDILVLVWRGTSNATDIHVDLRMTQRTTTWLRTIDSVARVHSGFLSRYTDTRGFVRDIVTSASIKAVVCMGHSLGGAIAHLAALDVSTSNPSLSVSCISFGSPKIGNASFCTTFCKHVPKNRCIISVNTADSVPTFPPFFGYYCVREPSYFYIDAGSFQKNHSLSTHALGTRSMVHLSQCTREDTNKDAGKSRTTFME
jgi:predicted lipase